MAWPQKGNSCLIMKYRCLHFHAKRTDYLISDNNHLNFAFLLHSSKMVSNDIWKEIKKGLVFPKYSCTWLGLGSLSYLKLPCVTSLTLYLNSLLPQVHDISSNENDWFERSMITSMALDFNSAIWSSAVRSLCFGMGEYIYETSNHPSAYHYSRKSTYKATQFFLVYRFHLIESFP